MFYFLLIIGSFFLVAVCCGIFFSAPSYHGPLSDHFDGRKFLNPDNAKPRGLFSLLRWMISRKRGPWNPQNSVGSSQLPKALEPSISFVNHSTFLICTGQFNILTDPVWSERVSPISWLGPKRKTAPGIDFNSLPEIHVVLISHNHYDHLDLETIQEIHRRFQPTFYCPLGVGLFLRKNKIQKVTELDWWDELRIDPSLNIQCVPAQHFSGRGMLDRDKTLWCGFILDLPLGKIFFAGDTGYSNSIFKTIGERLGPMDFSIIPIGAYKPTWFMSPVHCSPEEAVQIHLDVRSQISIASHFGTFPLADEGRDEAKNDLAIALKKRGLDPQSFLALREGESIALKKL